MSRSENEAITRGGCRRALRRVPYAGREGGLGTAFLAGGTRIQTLIATILAVAAAIVFAGPTGIVLLAVAGATALVVGQFATSRLSGVTGYVYGAVNELAAMAMFVVAALLTVCEGVGSEAIRGRGFRRAPVTIAGRGRPTDRANRKLNESTKESITS